MKNTLRLIALLAAGCTATSLFSASHGDHGWKQLFNDKWNEFHIIAKGDTITTFINGNQVTEMKLPRGIHRENPSGSIGFQVHGIRAGTGPYEVRWRNIMIKEL